MWPDILRKMMIAPSTISLNSWQKLADNNHEAYSYTHIRAELREHSGDRLIQTAINSRPKVVTFRKTARVMFHEYYKNLQQEKDTTKEEMKLVQAATKLIKRDIKTIETSEEVYPWGDDLQS